MRAYRVMLGLLLCSAAAVPALAQTAEQFDKRVGKLESEMRAVQRKVFPGGNRAYFEPEFQTPDPNAAPVGQPASSPIADLTARIDTLERQLRELTGQVEQTSFRQRQLEEAMTKFRQDAEYRLTQIESGGRPAAAPAAEAPPATTHAEPTVEAPASTGTAEAEAPPVDPIEAEWKAAYALVTAKQYAKAEPALQAIIAKYPKHERAASAQFWLGRAYYAQNSYALAAKTFLTSYQKYPKALRAPDSLYWLGQSLVGLKQPAEACRAYDELQTAYGAKMSATLKDQLTRARAAAKCGA